MKGHVFKLSGGPTQYPRMLKQLQLYAAVTYKSTPKISSLFDDSPSMPVIDTPGEEPTGTGKDGKITVFDEKIFDKKVKAYSLGNVKH